MLTKNRDNKKESFGSMTDDLGLFPVIDPTNSVPSRYDGDTMIDHMETYEYQHTA